MIYVSVVQYFICEYSVVSKSKMCITFRCFSPNKMEKVLPLLADFVVPHCVLVTHRIKRECRCKTATIPVAVTP